MAVVIMGKIKDYLGLLNFAATLKDAVEGLGKTTRQHRKKIDELGMQANVLAKAIDDRDRRIDALEARLIRLESVAMFGGSHAAQPANGDLTQRRPTMIGSDGAHLEQD